MTTRRLKTKKIDRHWIIRVTGYGAEEFLHMTGPNPPNLEKLGSVDCIEFDGTDAFRDAILEQSFGVRVVEQKRKPKIRLRKMKK